MENDASLSDGSIDEVLSDTEMNKIEDELGNLSVSDVENKEVETESNVEETSDDSADDAENDTSGPRNKLNTKQLFTKGKPAKTLKQAVKQSNENKDDDDDDAINVEETSSDSDDDNGAENVIENDTSASRKKRTTKATLVSKKPAKIRKQAENQTKDGNGNKKPVKYADMILQGFLIAKNPKRGMSLSVIMKNVSANTDRTLLPKSVKKAILECVEQGHLIQISGKGLSGSFKLTKESFIALQKAQKKSAKLKAEAENGVKKTSKTGNSKSVVPAKKEKVKKTESLQAVSSKSPSKQKAKLTPKKNTSNKTKVKSQNKEPAKKVNKKEKKNDANKSKSPAKIKLNTPKKSKSRPELKSPKVVIRKYEETPKKGKALKSPKTKRSDSKSKTPVKSDKVKTAKNLKSPKATKSKVTPSKTKGKIVKNSSKSPSSKSPSRSRVTKTSLAKEKTSKTRK